MTKQKKGIGNKLTRHPESRNRQRIYAVLGSSFRILERTESQNPQDFARNGNPPILNNKISDEV